uniref:RNA polymerase beta'' subunit, chloroplastic n=1 Tax=Tanacetum cinerariifolium TaxID=118510 RepID=A0A6L2JR57_TANCI|nr:RNA polymerase beta'' subunit, chloroplastic [Tanacetum cinerariifolium]
MVRNVNSPSKFLMYLRFLQVMINNQVNDLSSHKTKYTSSALTQKVFANMKRIGKEFPGIETLLFTTMLVQPQAIEEEEAEEDEVPDALTHHHHYKFNLKCDTLSQKVAHLDQDKFAQALDIIKLKQRVKKLEKKRRSKSSGLKRSRKVGTSQMVESSTETVVGAELQGRIEKKDDDNVAAKEVNAAEPTVFDDEEVTITMAQTLIKMKAKKARILYEQMAKRLQDEEIKQAAAREKQDQDDLKRAQHLDNIKKYQNLKRKLVSIAQARKNMFIYLKNMIGYKMEHFKGMSYNKVRPIFEREYNKVQTLFIPDKDVEKPSKKRVVEETLFQESFKKLKAVEISGSESTQDTPTIDPKEMSEEDVHNMLKIVLVAEFKVEALQVKLVKEKFSTAMPTEDKEKALWVELKRLYEPNAADVFWKLQRYMHDPLTWKLYTNCGVHQVSSTRRRDIFIFTKKNYPLTNAVMILMLSAKLQVDEDCEMARDLVMKIFMEANKPKSTTRVDDVQDLKKKGPKGLLLLVEVLALLVQVNVVRGYNRRYSMRSESMRTYLIVASGTNGARFRRSDLLPSRLIGNNKSIHEYSKFHIGSEFSRNRSGFSKSSSPGAYRLVERPERKRCSGGNDTCCAILLAVASLFFWKWELSSLAVGTSSADNK